MIVGFTGGGGAMLRHEEERPQLTACKVCFEWSVAWRDIDYASTFALVNIIRPRGADLIRVHHNSSLCTLIILPEC